MVLPGIKKEKPPAPRYAFYHVCRRILIFVVFVSKLAQQNVIRCGTAVVAN